MSIINATAREANNCKLISGTFETLVQIGLGIIALSVLVLKRTYEKPQRPFQCSFYFINFTLDTSLGVLLNWLLLRTTVAAAVRISPSFCRIHPRVSCSSTSTGRGSKCPGSTATPFKPSTYPIHPSISYPSVRVWLTQLLSWIAIVLTAKLVIARAIYAFSSPLNAFGNWLFEPLSNYPKLELLFVMVACPCLMNALQFWVTDNFLKKPAAQDARLIVDEKTPLV
ncbi:hypothetical protein DYB25_014089 [Aphanomyces astaci]|uniref:Uncharacterized protein n=1 Tax=Aphanomyces astaci TaxID=112090 RepID=A0A397BZV6_APHAT|nr:hypothetical protein DYB25_014089 [Aphanomyces astaci]